MMDIKAFNKALFDLVKECKEARAAGADVADQMVKEDDDGLWIRFTAIGSLLDYCENSRTESAFAYCAANMLLIADLVDLLGDFKC